MTTEEKETLRKKFYNFWKDKYYGLGIEYPHYMDVFDFFISLLESKDKEIAKLLEVTNPEHKRESAILLAWLEKRIEMNDYQRQYFHFAFSDILKDNKEAQSRIEELESFIKEVADWKDDFSSTMHRIKAKKLISKEP